MPETHQIKPFRLIDTAPGLVFRGGTFVHDGDDRPRHPAGIARGLVIKNIRQILDPQLIACLEPGWATCLSLVTLRIAHTFGDFSDPQTIVQGRVGRFALALMGA